MHGATFVYFGVITHVRGVEVLDRKVGNSITELVVTCCDEDSLRAVKGVSDVKFRATPTTIFQKVRELNAV